MMRKLKRALMHYGGNITLNIKTLVLIVANHFFIKKDYTKTSSNETLAKKWCQWRRICEVSFGINKEEFPKIEFTSLKKEHKKLITYLSERLLKIHRTHYWIKVKLEMHYLFI